ncbi:MAG: AsmA-like C-terminal region-containing protein [Pseudomonadota bacterium]
MTPPSPPRRRRRGFWARSLGLCLRSIIGGALIAAIAVGLLYLRLMEGPIQLPYLAEMASETLNEGSTENRVSIGRVVLALADGAEKPAVQFEDVRVTTMAGEPVFAVPKLSATFHLSDLLSGRLQPVRLTLIRPEARVVRSADGRLRVGLGVGAEPAESGAGQGSAAGGMDALARVLDGLVGDAPAVEELARLAGVSVSDATVSYFDPAGVQIGRTVDTDLELWRDADGLVVTATISLTQRNSRRARIRIAANRRRGAESSRIRIALDNFRPRYLADEIAGLEWLKMIDAPVEARLSAALGRTGGISDVQGLIRTENGRLMVAEAEPQSFDLIETRFRVDPEAERLDISELTVRAPAIQAAMTGLLGIERDEPGGRGRAVGQLSVKRLDLDLPEVFAEPLHFDGGQIVGEVDLESLTTTVADARLNRGPLSFDLQGKIRPTSGGWHTDLRVAGRQVTIADMIAHWPLPAAVNARNWVADNLVSGVIEDLVAHFRIGEGDPEVNLDLRYADLTSRYLGEMPPITGAHGRAHLTLHDFTLSMDRGEIAQGAGAPLRLDGSSIVIDDLWGEVTPADIDLRVTGPTRAALGLIDEEPLGFVSKLGLDPETVGGQARIVTALRFPLIQDLLLEQIDVTSRADLTDVVLPVPDGGDGPAAIATAERLLLLATIEEMRISGDLALDDVPLTVDWREIYGETPSRRQIRISGALTPDILARHGMGGDIFPAGEIPIQARIAQSGAGDAAVEISADLTPAALDPKTVDWSKPAGAPGALTARGRIGEGIVIEGFELSAADLSATGTARFSHQGRLERAALSQFRLGEKADLDLVVRLDDEGALVVTLTGARFDTAVFEDRGDEDAVITGAPLLIDFNVEEVIVGPKITLSPVGGTYRRLSDGAVTLEANGQVARQAPFRIDYVNEVGEPGTLRLTSSDAGRLLSAAGFFMGATGGDLTLDAQIAPDDVTDFSGRAQIGDLVVRNALTFQSILEEGGANEALDEAQGGGIRFRRVDIPFAYGDGVLTLGTSVATSPALALKVDGTVDEDAGTLDLAGVISPAYAVTGALDNVPVLGRILSGGEGEGIFAMTFQVTGKLADPTIRVNPLSLLTPGLLRNLFSKRGQEPDARFLEGLQRDN